MQTIILCGGRGTRMKEETDFRPKPMVEVGGVPILWHIMRGYMHYGFNEFIIALGYKGDMIKNYFLNWRTMVNDFTYNMITGETTIHNNNHGDFKITFVNTGLETLTGARIKTAAKYLKKGEKDFMLTYGDGVSDVDLNKILDFHYKQGTLGTVTGVHPQSRFGLIDVVSKTNIINRLRQKPIMNEYISGGFMVFKKEAVEYFDDGDMENGLIRLVNKQQLSLFPHEGFWKCVDTYNELEQLNKLWDNGRPWAVWEKKKS
jgi:glucose-1-phosphate cytidylyltransferase